MTPKVTVKLGQWSAHTSLMDLAALSRLGDVVLWDCASNKLHHIHQQYNTPKVIHFLSLHRPAISQDSSICILNNYGQTSRVLPSPTEHIFSSKSANPPVITALDEYSQGDFLITAWENSVHLHDTRTRNSYELTFQSPCGALSLLTLDDTTFMAGGSSTQGTHKTISHSY